MERFDAEFKVSSGTRAGKLKEAIGELMTVLAGLPGDVGARVEVRLSNGRVPYSVYQFDKKLLFVPYIMEPTRDAKRIPALLLESGDMADRYLKPDLAYLLRNSPPVPHAEFRSYCAPP